MPTSGSTRQAAATNTVGRAGRRTHHRVECDLAADFTIRNTGQTGRAQCMNLGLGGLRVDFPVEIVIPAEIELRIHVPDGEPLEAAARVVWTVTDRIEGPFPTGLQFQELPDAQRRRLYDLVGSLMS